MPLLTLFLAFPTVATLDREILAAHVLRVSRAAVVAHLERALTAAELKDLRQLLTRAAAGEPVAYLTGRQFFYNHAFAVSPAVLIPRADTELLVEQTLAVAADLPAPRILEIGTGSGCIAISLALALPNAKVTATDLSSVALAVAHQNAVQLGARVVFFESDLLANVPLDEWDFIVSNPPYIAEHDAALAENVRRFEPATALFGGGSDGLDLPRRLLREIAALPKSPRIVLLELAPWQLDPLATFAKTLCKNCKTKQHADLAGRARVLEIQFEY